MPAIRTHGLSRIAEFRIWMNIFHRCYNRKHRSFKDYGGRGIIMSYEWYISPERFIHDMGPRPSPQHTIERLDNDGPYSKENCIWATRNDQARNKRNNVNLTFNGRTMCLTAWAEEAGVAQKTLWDRIASGWPMEKALAPKKFKSRPIEISFNGKTMCVAEWARELNVDRYALYSRLEHGWSHEETLSTPINYNLSRKKH